MLQRLILMFLVLSGTARADEFFDSKIEPLLRDRCFECHSHAHTIESGLALDSRSGWEQGGHSGLAIIPGEPDKSLLIKMVRWTDESHQMPPSEQLSAEEVALLEEWVRRGAPDPREMKATASDPMDWWSLKPLRRPDVPSALHPIDAFIQSKLMEEGITTSHRADRRTLIRRVYLDLHGVLPTPEEVEAFVSNPDPQAWESLVDELLASPRYGQRWARHWLDVIHFADSHGCEHDVKRPNAWRYRDYVIDRFNADVPWRRFIHEQLAADVFYPDEPQLTAALGFIAAGPLELSRAGTAPVTFDYLDRDDIVTQTMAAFTSTTANCARCHSHKFDPITQEDYYALQAVFAGVGKGDIELDRSAAVMRQRRQWNEVLSAVNRRDARILLHEDYVPVVEQWVAARRNANVDWIILEPEIFVSGGGATLTRQSDGSIFADGPLPDAETYTITSDVGLSRLSAVRLEVLSDERLPKGGPGRAGNGNLHLTEFGMQWFADGSDTPQTLKIAHASADFDQDGWTAMQAIDGDLQSGWAIYPRVNQPHHIVFELADPMDVSGGGKLAVTIKQLHPPKHVIGRFRLSATEADGDAARVLPPEVVEALMKPAERRTESEQLSIATAALHSRATEEIASLPPMDVVYAVSSSWSHAKKLSQPQEPKIVHLLRRGAIDQPVREVSAGALSAIPGLPARFELADPSEESSRRAALAEWIAHRDNPLTWRSVVNRVWHYHFGRGICDTPNDFGRMGGEPTHPELLDWLAVWFREDANGSLKQLHRLILTSETWQQASSAPSHRDEDDRWWSKMNRRRMDAEAYRDSVLRISGRLDWTMGGPGVEQFSKTEGPQSTPSLDYTAYDWNAQTTHRRSIYRVVWRGIPDPFMEALDFPDAALLTPNRGASVSALQSLALYNNDFVLSAATWFADRVRRETAPDDWINRAVQLCWQRDPTDSERKKFESYTNQHGLPALCRVLLNSNELLFVD